MTSINILVSILASRNSVGDWIPNTYPIFCTSVNCHVPLSAAGWGRYIGKTIVNMLSADGSQFDSLSAPGLAF